MPTALAEAGARFELLPLRFQNRRNIGFEFLHFGETGPAGMQMFFCCARIGLRQLTVDVGKHLLGCQMIIHWRYSVGAQRQWRPVRRP